MKSNFHKGDHVGSFSAEKREADDAKAHAESVVDAVLAKAALRPPSSTACTLCHQPFTPRWLPTLKRWTVICFPCAVRKFREVCEGEGK